MVNSKTYATRLLNFLEFVTMPKSLIDMRRTILKFFPSSFSDADLPDKFAEYFENKISMIRSSFYALHHQDDDLSKDTFSAREAEDIGLLHTTNYMSEFYSITGEDLNYILSKLNNKNYMFDPAPLSVLKPCSSIINPVLRLIVTRSFAESTFPNQLKHATITPIIKNTNLDPDNFKNYRPISNTPYLAKVLEKAAFYQINDHLINNGLYCPN